MRYTVYKTTNLINGKFYVGLHSTENPQDSYLGSGNLIKAAIKKYGRANFKKEILHDFDSAEEMAAREGEIVTSEFIARADTYNLARGGENPFEHVTSEQRAEWGRRGNRNRTASEKSRQASRQNIINARKNGLAGPPPVRGRFTHTATTKSKMRASGLGRKNSQFGTSWVWKDGERPQKILKSELDLRLAEGWQRGRKGKKVKLKTRSAVTHPSPTKGRCWVHQGVKAKMIPKGELDAALSQGWHRGQSPAAREARSDYNRTTCWVHHPMEGERKIKKAELPTFQAGGWLRGRK